MVLNKLGYLLIFGHGVKKDQGQAMAKKLFKIIMWFGIAAVAAALILIVSTTRIVLPAKDITVSNKNVRAYRLHKDFILLVWSDEVFIVYTKEKWVGTPNDYRNKIGGEVFWPRSSTLLFWPKNAYVSVPLGHLKRDTNGTGEKFVFGKNNVLIQAVLRTTGKLDSVKVQWK